MENLTLFESFVVWLCRNKNSVAITAGIAYGHRIYKQGRFQFTDVDPTMVVIDSEGFAYKATTLDELIKFSKAIRD